MQKLHTVVAQAHQQHADGKAGEIERGEVGVFFQLGEAAHDAREKRHQHPRDKTAQAHGGQAQPRNHVADGGAGQNRVAQCVANQAHAPHHQKHAHGRGGQGKEHNRR